MPGMGSAIRGNALAQMPGVGAGRPAGLGLGIAAPATAGYGLPATASLATAGYGAGALGTAGADYAGSAAYGAGAYGWGWSGPGTNPYYGYLSGAADVTIADAKYWKIIQEARLVREEANRSYLDTRRKIQEEAAYERAEWLKQYDPLNVKIRDDAWNLAWARNDPPLPDILSGKALNTLLNHVSKQQGRGERGPNVPLNEDLLKGINLSGADTRANAGLLKFDGQLQWPLPLEGSDFADSRENLTKLLQDAVNRAKGNSQVSAGKLKDMKAELGRLNNTLLNNVGEMSPSDYLQAKRFLNLVDDSIKALEDPNAANFFNQNWAAKSRNVAELVKYMSEKGLLFAPAVPGDADAYRALYRALQSFDAGMAIASSGSGGGER
jgi:hypothetical protein